MTAAHLSWGPFPAITAMPEPPVVDHKKAKK